MDGRLQIAAGAALVGTAVLAVWFGSKWPVTGWQVVSRQELAAKGREVTKHFGLNTDDWAAYEVAKVSKSLVEYRSEHALDESPLSVRVTYVAKKGKQAAEVGFDSGGRWNYWRPPRNFKGGQKLDSDAQAANAVFEYMAGTEKASYKNAVRSMGDEAHEQDYVWKKTPIAHSGVRESIEVACQDGVIRRVERKSYISSLDEDSSDDYGHKYWEVIAGLLGIIGALGVVVIISIYILWLARGAISHQFSIRIGLAALLIMLASLIWGVAWERMRSVNLDENLPVFGSVVLAAIIGCFVAVGRGISEAARPKWMSLEQLCLLAPVARSTGESLAAGLLFSPLLVAVPFLIAGCGLFPHSLVLPRHAELLYSPSPMLDSLNVPGWSYLLGFWGFGVPALERLIRFRWLRWLILLPIGAIFFADEPRVVSGPLADPLAAGVLTFALFWFVWTYFDMLAVLTLQITSGLVLSWLMLVQKGHGVWSLSAAVAALVLAAVWCRRRGVEAAEGDPMASVPSVVGFRAEREKLRAEFSVARRAQEDMLPRTPPRIPGYSIAASCTPSLDVGGDLYDFLKLPDGRFGIGVADVSGKGVPAALYMTLTKGLLASITKESSSLGTVVEEVNRHLHSVTRKKVFVTMALGFLDAKNGVLECVRAGHNPLVWRQRSRSVTTLVSPSGLGLGITTNRVFGMQLKVAEMVLSEGDAVVFYSDGITEAMNTGLEQFGEQRLMEAVEKTDSLDATATRDSILCDVREFLGGVHPQDDMTLVVLRVGEHQ